MSNYEDDLAIALSMSLEEMKIQNEFEDAIIASLAENQQNTSVCPNCGFEGNGDSNICHVCFISIKQTLLPPPPSPTNLPPPLPPPPPPLSLFPPPEKLSPTLWRVYCPNCRGMTELEIGGGCGYYIHGPSPPHSTKQVAEEASRATRKGCGANFWWKFASSEFPVLRMHAPHESRTPPDGYYI